MNDRATLVEEAYELLDGQRWVSWIETPLTGAEGILRVGREIPPPAETSSGAESADGRPEAQPRPAPAQVLRLVATNGRRVQRVLLAEDDEVNALLALQSLERVGAIVDWAQDGDEALSLVKSAFAGDRPAYDAILMDLRMPRVDGYEATRQIRRLEAAMQRAEPARIIAISATTMRQDRAAAAAAGIDVFLPKPYSPETLLTALSPVGGASPRAS
jgi:CheY-like chemotaxis protein